ncbi:hypothetical protein [Streptomyces sp. NPDC057582]|uniref:hypothetical protein n=1 Tax=Streptomyces sp. NPDC057582 TaxID=3346174 RepID=UPI003682D015
MNLALAGVVLPVVLAGAASDTDQGAVQQDHHPAGTGDLLQCPVQPWRTRGEEFDDFLHPAAHGEGGDIVTAGHVGQALVVTEHGEHDERLVAGGLAPTGADLMTATAYRTGNEIDGPLRQREPDLAANVVRASPRSA